MEKLSFIHAADLHLGGTFKGLSYLPNHLLKVVNDSPYKALENIVNIAILNKVDFVLFVGDTFDTPTPTPKSQYEFIKQLNRLAEENISVYISKGNHDGNNGKWLTLDLPKNTYVFKDDVIEEYIFRDTVSIQGFSYSSGANYNRMANKFKRNNQTTFNIAVYHGSNDGESSHAPYAPFNISELLEKEFDYWALGHIHKSNILKENPFIIYPGNPQGQSKKETGDKGCFLVKLSNKETKIEFIKTSAIIWLKETIEIEEKDSFVEITTKIELLRKKILEKYQKSLVIIEFINMKPSESIDMYEFNELVNSVYNKDLPGSNNFSCLIEILETNINNSFENKSEFFRELDRSILGVDEFNKVIKPLTQKTYKYLNSTCFDKEEILKDAKRLISKLR
ncbi:MAG: repair exonuclease family protein YhaO [Bacillales bacterium]|jgi:DNA repair exonuclease SbcCD nuclease subunit|nr:repair exonuclease family protein YhaO [Bacillales bacterium]